MESLCGQNNMEEAINHYDSWGSDNMHSCFVVKISLVPGDTYLKNRLAYWTWRKFLKHQENVSKQYKRANWNQTVIVFENFQKKLIEALSSVDSNQWYAVYLSDW